MNKYMLLLKIIQCKWQIKQLRNECNESYIIFQSKFHIKLCKTSQFLIF